jgi:hypothetical protein
VFAARTMSQKRTSEGTPAGVTPELVTDSAGQSPEKRARTGTSVPAVVSREDSGMFACLTFELIVSKRTNSSPC